MQRRWNWEKKKKNGGRNQRAWALTKRGKKDESKFRTRIKEQTEKKGLVQFLGGHIAQWALNSSYSEKEGAIQQHLGAKNIVETGAQRSIDPIVCGHVLIPPAHRRTKGVCLSSLVSLRFSTISSKWCAMGKPQQTIDLGIYFPSVELLRPRVTNVVGRPATTMKEIFPREMN